ncbi:THAP domain-containing protein 2-like [Rhipicephalus microplus]|uniref:THAP domain-containing protein 2-like n=1 Tax=Rhipicephalus microplus TaxID=6941 RepID=UPI003F6BE09E
MPGCCCVPNCKSNCDRGPSVRVYRSPSDRIMQAAWTSAVTRKDFMPTKSTLLCEKHFLPLGYLNTTSYTDVQRGKVVEVIVKNSRLKQTAGPSSFPNCPAYLSHPQPCVQEAPDVKIARLEATG